jgi:hypothetical protein
LATCQKVSDRAPDLPFHRVSNDYTSQQNVVFA